MNKTLLNFLLVCFSLCSTVQVFGQNASEPKNANEDETSFSFGNISPVILAKGGIEVSTTSDLSSYWIVTKYGTKIIDRYRISRFESNLNLQYGIAENKRWDIGAQLKYARIRLDENSRNSPFKIFSAPDVSSSSYQGISAAGLRIRTTPFKNNQSLTVQGSVFVPIIKDKPTRAALSADRIQTDLTGTYFIPLNQNNDIYFYLQGRYTLLIANKENGKTNHFPGISALIVKSFLNRKLFVFPGLSYTGSYQQNVSGGRLNKQGDFLFASIGAQVQIASALSIFINTQRPWIYRSGVNVYSDLVKNSYSDWALGLRVVL